jgi:hypothetical protein
MGDPVIKEKIVDVRAESLEVALHLEKVSEDEKGWGAKCTAIVINGLPKEGLIFNRKTDHYLVMKGTEFKLLEVTRLGHRITDPDT